MQNSLGHPDYEGMGGRDYPGVETTDRKLRVVGDLNIITRCQTKLLKAEMLYVTVYGDNDDNVR